MQDEDRHQVRQDDAGLNPGSKERSPIACRSRAQEENYKAGREGIEEALAFGTGDQFSVLQALTGHFGHDLLKPASIAEFPLIEAESFFIEIPEQMPFPDGNVRPAQHSLQQRPEVLDAVRVDFPFHIADGVVDHLMDVFR